MSTDSTELTFVRCPSCRSLVPAVSTRCRMCGATLDASQKAEEDKDTKRSGRVRQRTMSAPSSDLSSAAEAIRQELGSADAEASQGKDDLLNDDPLAALGPIEEVESAAPDSDALIDDPLSAYIEEVEVKDSANGSTGKSKRDAAPASRAESEESASRPEEVQRPKVIVESGPRRPNRPSNLSFGKSTEERPRAEEPARKSEASAKPIRERREQRASFSEDVSEAPESAPRTAASRKTDGPEVAGTPSGRLCGWLVSFKDPKGAGIELREGRFFVTQSSLKPNDMVLDDESISTPHALVAVTVADGMKVQDLMSEKGVWLRRRGNESFQRITEAARVEHGDWVRFGEVEYLISFLPAANAKSSQ